MILLKRLKKRFDFCQQYNFFVEMLLFLLLLLLSSNEKRASSSKTLENGLSTVNIFNIRFLLRNTRLFFVCNQQQPQQQRRRCRVSTQIDEMKKKHIKTRADVIIALKARSFIAK